VAKLLVVDDEPSICWGLKRLGESLGHEVVTASSAEQALELVAAHRPEVIVLDVRLPGMDGLTAIARFRETLGAVPIIVITAYGDLPTAVTAVREGAFEYLVKPFDLEQMQRAWARALAVDRQAAPAKPAALGVSALVGTSPPMQEVFTRIALAAAADVCVLVTGESGTGKELVARAIHRYSARADGPFAAVNVASLSPTLAESELFGHVRGAFTGAEAPRSGLLVQANGGTLFLDEVADIPLPTQVKLLRALEQGEVLPVGANRTVPTDFRVVSATHQPLLQKVQDGSFRHDLYFRLCAFQIHIPPLRERLEDIPELADHFLNLARCGDGARPVLSREALAELVRRPWYGNVRELRNALEHAVIVARGGSIQPEHLPPPVASAAFKSLGDAPSTEESLRTLVREWAQQRLADPQAEGRLYDELLAVIEPPLFRAALEKHRAQCATAARSLGLHRTTLRKKLDEYGIGEL
jgi:two-component system nitrogen regulation response regulator GlnG